MKRKNVSSPQPENTSSFFFVVEMWQLPVVGIGVETIGAGGTVAKVIDTVVGAALALRGWE